MGGKKRKLAEEKSTEQVKTKNAKGNNASTNTVKSVEKVKTKKTKGKNAFTNTAKSAKQQEQKTKGSKNHSIASHVMERMKQKRLKEEEEAVHLIKVAQEQKKIKLFNSLIGKLGKQKLLHVAIQAYDTCLSCGLTPDQYTLTAMVTAYIKCGELEQAKDFIDSMAETVRPNEVTYTILIKGLCENGDLNEAWDIIQRMKDEELPLSHLVYNPILGACVFWGDAVMAELVVQDMIALEITLSEHNYEYLIRVYSQNSRLDLIDELVEHMQENNVHFSPTIISFLAMTYAIHDKINEAAQMISTLPQAINEAKLAMAEEGKHGRVKQDKNKFKMNKSRQPYADAAMDRLKLHQVDNEMLRVKDYLAIYNRVKKNHQVFRSSDRVFFFHERDNPGCKEQEDRILPIKDICKASKKNKIHLEICMGHGDWILHRAQTQPNIKWFGLEIRFDRVHQTWCKTKLKNVDNLWLLNGEAHDVITNCLGDNTFDEIYINHPTPPITEDNKQQLITEDFLRELKRILVPKGKLTILTDAAPYAVSIVHLLQDTPLKNEFKSLDGDEPFQVEVPEDYGSSYFDIFFSQMGKHQRYFMQYNTITEKK